MKRLILTAGLFAAVFALKGDDEPTLDLIAGWGWSPFYYDRYPYEYGPYGRGYPAIGLGVPLNRWNGTAPVPYGYYGYAPFWGYEAGIRIKLNDKGYASALSDGLLQPLPGSAPTELHDPKRELHWRSDLETLFGRDPSSENAAPTNAAPKLLTPNF